jgi:hypothetical protein
MQVAEYDTQTIRPDPVTGRNEMKRPANLPKVAYLSGAALLSALAILITRKIFFSALGPVVVDYWAFAAGLLLIGEGFCRMIFSREQTFRINLFRLLRIVIGVCILMVHYLQFVRDGKLGA